MEEFKRIPFGGNPYADFEFFKVELKVCDVKYTPEQIYAHFEFTSGYKVDVQGTFYPSLIRKAIVQVREMEQAHITNSSRCEIHADTNIEFYNTPEGDVMIKELGHAAVVLCEDNRPTIEYMLAVIRE